MSQKNWGSSNSGFGTGASDSFNHYGSSNNFRGGSFSTPARDDFSSFSDSTSTSNLNEFSKLSWGDNGNYTPIAKTGGWCIPLTIASLLCIGVTFLLAYFTKDTFRSVPLFGLVFALPIILLMLLVLGIESFLTPMNPRYSRKYQTLIAACIAGLYLFSGCLGEFFHEHVVIQGQNANVIILLDKSGSMALSPEKDGSSYDELCVDALENLLNNVPPTTNIGFIAFDSDILSNVPIDIASHNKSKIFSQMKMSPTGGTDFEKPLTLALNSLPSSHPPTKVLLITDGNGSLGSDSTLQWFQTTCKEKNASIYYVYINQPEPYADLQKLVEQTNGKSVSVDNASSILDTLQNLNLFVAEDDLFHTVPKKQRDVIINCFIQIIPSIALGFALFLMLSRQGQKRVQLILTPFLGIAAFFIMNFVHFEHDSIWLSEAIAQSLPLLVFMRKNT